MDDTSLKRFEEAQHNMDMYEAALLELRAGRKRRHWMWFIFPQLRGLGESEASRYFGISGLDEARAYLQHPVLGNRLITATLTVLSHSERKLTDIFPSPDDIKFVSCMTLFARVPHAPLEFEQAIDTFAQGHHDPKTIKMIEEGRS